MKYVCPICGTKQPVERTVFSRWTRNHYCAAIDACKERASRAKRGRAAKKAAA